ncbi:serpin B6-like [Neodiprion virginianus]|uniref:serpin B6-like n=1 Tax=Neodiprion virginianus TaxID=2961670 RepID=UPI001EE76D0E|nr:serpin B6-like [Neodiprion virginianus]
MADKNTDALRKVALTTGEFSKNFLTTVAGDTSSNLVVSPLSAQVALAMAAYGAGGKTATQMRKSLLLPEDNQLGQSGYKSLIERLNGVKEVELRIANKIYPAKQFVIKSAYKELTARKFLSRCEELDFHNSEAAARTINSWCEQQTNNRIKDVIARGSLHPNTALVLVNAAYFKGSWAKRFDPSLTADRPFHLNDKTSKIVPTMFLKHTFRFGHLPEVNARFIELPYRGNELSMVIILPKEVNGLKAVRDNLHKVNLAARLKRTGPSHVELSLPKFKIETTLNLEQSLKILGMTDMFQDGADFSGIADSGLKISKVVQKTFIEVNEEGSEAAAATVIVAMPISLDAQPPPPERFIVDRPVYYAIYHRDLEVTLFNGFLHQPSVS